MKIRKLKIFFLFLFLLPVLFVLALPGIIVVLLESPASGSTDTDGNVTFVCNASDTEQVVNISLYTNTTGTWGLNQTIHVGQAVANMSEIVALLHLNNAVTDDSGYSNDGTLYGGLGYIAGNFYQGLDFVGDVTKYVTIPDQPYFSPGNNDFTILMWVNSDDTLTRKIAAKGGSGGSDWEWILEQENIGRLYSRFSMYSLAGANRCGANNAGTLTAGVWHLIGGSYDGTNCYAILDTTVTSAVRGTDDLGDGISPVYLGKRGDGSGSEYDGQMDEVMIFNRSLSSAEISAIYNYNKTFYNASFDINNIASGDYIWNCLGYDNNSNLDWGNSNFTLTVELAEDITNPITTLGINPVDDLIDNDGSVTFDLKCGDNINVSNLTLYGNWSGSWIANITNSTPVNDTWWNVSVSSIPSGNWEWGGYCMDNSSNDDWSENRTLTIDFPPNVTLYLPEDDSTDADGNITFKCNVTDDNKIINVSLWTNTTGTWSLNQTYTPTYSNGLSYRMPINVTNQNSTTNLTDYATQVIMDLSTISSKIQSDCDDFRFTYYNKTSATENSTDYLDYFLEDCNVSGDSIFWVEVPFLQNKTNETIYMYYGNSTLTSMSDLNSVGFLFTDNFSRSSFTEITSIATPHADTCAVTIGTDIYIIGGYDVGAADTLDETCVYNTVTDSSYCTDVMPIKKWGMYCTYLESTNKIYVFGGNTGGSDNLAILIFNVTDGHWYNPSVNAPTGFGNGVWGTNNGTHVFITRGVDYTIWAYNTATEGVAPYNWSDASGTPPIPRRYSGWGSAEIYNNKLYLFNGRGYTEGKGINEVYALNFTDGLWYTMASSPFGTFGHNRENMTIGDAYYLVAGQRVGGEFSSVIYKYNYTTNTWSQGAMGLYARDGNAGGVVGNKIYTFGGRSDVIGPYGLNIGEYYDTTLDGNIWVQVDGGFEMRNGFLTQNRPLRGYTGGAFNPQIYIADYQTASNTVIRYRMDTMNTLYAHGVGFASDSGKKDVDYDGYWFMFDDIGTDAYKITEENNGVESTKVSTTTYSTGNNTFEIRVNSTTINVYKDDSLYLTSTDTTYRGGYIHVYQDMPGSAIQGQNFTIDWLFVKNFQQDEPTVYLGSEESIGGTIVNASFNLTNLDDNIYMWNCKAYDNNNQVGWGDSNWTFTVLTFQQYNTTITQTITTNSSLGRLGSIKRTFIFSIIFKNFVDRLSRNIKEIIQQISISEITSRLFEGFRTLLENPNFSDSITRLFKGLKTSPQSLALVVLISNFFSGFKTPLQNIHFSDNGNAQFAGFRTPYQPLTFADSATSLFSGFRDSPQNIYFSTVVNNLFGIIRTPSQTLTFNALISNLFTGFKTSNQNIFFSDSPDPTLSSLRSSPQTLTLGDSVIRLLGGLRFAYQNLYFSLNLPGAGGQSLRTIPQSLTISDSISNLITTLRNPSQNILFSDSVFRLFKGFRNSPQNIYFSDDFIRILNGFRTSLQNILFSDFMFRLFTGFKMPTQNIYLSDEADSTFGGLRTPHQPLTISDSISNLYGIIRNPSQTITFNVLVSNLLTGFKTSNQNIFFSDSPDPTLSSLRNAPQTLTLGDSVMRLFGGLRLLAQNTFLSDSFTRLLASFRTSPHNIYFSFSLPEAGGSNTRTISQSLTISDSINNLVTTIRNPTQNILFSDSVFRLFSGFRLQSQNILFSDTFTRLFGGTRVSNQNILFSDDFIRLLNSFRTSLQNIYLSDSFTRLFSGTTTPTQNILFSDSTTSLFSGFRNPPQNIYFSTSITRLFAGNIISSQNIYFSDSLTRLFASFKISLQNIYFSIFGTGTRGGIYDEVISQSIIFSDSINRLFTGFKIIPQNIFFSDSAISLFSGFRTSEQSLTISDSFDRMKDIPRTISQTISFSIFQDRAISVFRTILQSINWVLELVGLAPISPGGGGGGVRMIKCYQVVEDSFCISEYFYEIECPKGYFDNLEECETSLIKIIRIPKDLQEYWDYLAGKISPNNLQRGRIITMALLILLIFYGEFMLFKKIKLKKKF